VTGEAQIAVSSEPWLGSTVFFGIAGVQTVALDGELLVPKRQSASESRVRFVTIHAKIGARAGDGRSASPAQIMHADYIPAELSQQGLSGQDQHQAR
jgi:hypothetical protein